MREGVTSNCCLRQEHSLLKARDTACGKPASILSEEIAALAEGNHGEEMDVQHVLLFGQDYAGNLRLACLELFMPTYQALER